MPKWTLNPVCAAQKLLEEKFQKGEITSEMTATQAQATEKLFGTYSKAVFGNNYRRQRLLNGLECKSQKC